MPFRRRRVKLDLTSGRKLQNARRRKKMTLEEAEAATSVRLKYLKALEEDDFLTLPGKVYAVGFAARYAEFLLLDAGRIVNQFRREYELYLKTTGGNRLILKPKVSEPKIVITPKTLIIAASAVAVLSLACYIGYEIKKFATPPQIDIISPTSDRISEAKIEIIGKTEPTAELTINGQNVPLSEDGTFQEEIALQKGLNNVEIKAVSRADREAVRVLRVYAEIP